MILGAVCALVIACKTAGTPPQSEAAAGSQSSSSSSEAAALAQAATPSSGLAAPSQAAPAEGSADRNGTAGSRVVVRTVSIPLIDFVRGTEKKLGELYSAVAGHKNGPARAIEYAAVAAIIIAVGATAAVRVRRHRRLTPSPLEAPNK